MIPPGRDGAGRWGWAGSGVLAGKGGENDRTGYPRGYAVAEGRARDRGCARGRGWARGRGCARSAERAGLVGALIDAGHLGAPSPAETGGWSEVPVASKPHWTPVAGENCDLIRNRAARTSVVWNSVAVSTTQPVRSMGNAAALGGVRSCADSSPESVTAWITSVPRRGNGPIRSGISR